MSDTIPEPDTHVFSKDQLEADLDAWKSLRINIGVIGEQTELKKHLINKLVGINQSNSPSISSPPTTTATTTTTAVPYTHCNNVNLVVWDLKASSEKELANCDLSSYDLLILFRDKPSSSSSADQKLIESLEKRGKKCLVVTFDSAARFDLSKLHFDIMQALMLLTRDHIASYGLSIEPASKQIVDAKTSILRSRIEKVAWLSSTFGHILNLPKFSILCSFSFRLI